MKPHYSRIKLSYIAGFVDGEGSFTIGYYNSSKKRGRYHKVVLQICQKDISVLQYIQIFLNVGHSSIYLREKTGVYYLRYQGKNAEEIAKLLYPYLIVKKSQAQVVVEFSKLKKKLNGKYYQKITSSDLLKRNDLMNRIRGINDRFKLKPRSPVAIHTN